MGGDNPRYCRARQAVAGKRYQLQSKYTKSPSAVDPPGTVISKFGSVPTFGVAVAWEASCSGDISMEQCLALGLLLHLLADEVEPKVPECSCEN